MDPYVGPTLNKAKMCTNELVAPAIASWNEKYRKGGLFCVRTSSRSPESDKLSLGLY